MATNHQGFDVTAPLGPSVVGRLFSVAANPKAPTSSLDLLQQSALESGGTVYVPPQHIILTQRAAIDALADFLTSNGFGSGSQGAQASEVMLLIAQAAYRWNRSGSSEDLQNLDTVIGHAIERGVLPEQPET